MLPKDSEPNLPPPIAQLRVEDEGRIRVYELCNSHQGPNWKRSSLPFNAFFPHQMSTPQPYYQDLTEPATVLSYKV